jgi:hypothetical protein
MEAKEYLESYRSIQTRINVLMAEIERLRAEAESVGFDIDGMPKGTANNDKMSRIVAQMVDLESMITEELSGLYIRRMRIITLLGKLKSHKHQLLLQKRYIECKSWEHIAVEMDITWRHCYRLHGSALAEFQEVLNNG